MRVDVVVPQLGEAVAEVTIATWYKHPGEAVRKGEPLFQVDMDKSVIDVEAFEDGVLAEVLVPEGSGVTPLTVVARLDVAGAADLRPAGPAAAVAAQEPARQTAGPASGLSPRGGAPNASPRARRLADSLGVDLGTVTGTGPGGMITEQDVRARGAS